MKFNKLKYLLTQKAQKGFTLLEILLVVAAISILASIVILAINPNKQLGDTRNAQRKADVNTYLNAVYQYSLDNNGNLPASINSNIGCVITGAPQANICKTGGSCTGLTDLSVLTASEKYLVSLPVDPSGGTTNGTNYFVVKDAFNRVTVCAISAENTASISATR